MVEALLTKIPNTCFGPSASMHYICTTTTAEIRADTTQMTVRQLSTSCRFWNRISLQKGKTIRPESVGFGALVDFHRRGLVGVSGRSAPSAQTGLVGSAPLPSSNNTGNNLAPANLNSTPKTQVPKRRVGVSLTHMKRIFFSLAKSDLEIFRTLAAEFLGQIRTPA